MPKPIAADHQIPDPAERPPELAPWQSEGLKADLALIENALAAIDIANEATRETCYRVAMAETRHCVKGIQRLPINLVTRRLLEDARDAAKARLAGRPVASLELRQRGRPRKASKPKPKAKAPTCRASQPETAS